jgi:putative endonuclease
MASSRRRPGSSKAREKMKEKFYVYVTASLHNRVLYIGMTSDLTKRIWEHKNKVVKGFSKTYNVDRLVYFETYDDAENAIKRERNMKEWKRQWKIDLIEKENPNWNDLYETIAN